MQFSHDTVLRKITVEHLNIQPGDIAIDCTAGGGGHTDELLSLVGTKGKVLAFDQDETAITHLRQRFATELADGRLLLVHEKFSSIATIAQKFDFTGKVKAICADIGVSSPQIDDATRGFSFSNDGPLSMVMSTTLAENTAADIVNTFELDDLTDIFRRFGEEPQARRIARAIVEARQTKPIERTSELATIVSSAVHYKSHSKKHPATKVFQALRIAVNHELDELEQLITKGFSILAPHGRLAIISFHSLEDRIVKSQFKALAGISTEQSLQRHVPLLPQNMPKPKGLIIKPFPMMPDDAEISANARSRSAKLRVIEKLD